MSKINQLKLKIDKHNAYYQKKTVELYDINETDNRWLNRYSRLMDLSKLIAKLVIKLNEEMMIGVFREDEVDKVLDFELTIKNHSHTIKNPNLAHSMAHLKKQLDN